LLDEFTEQHELSNQEIAACEQQIFELEALIVKSRERLELVAHDRERVLQMLERYSGDQFVLSQRLEPRPEKPATEAAQPAKPPCPKPAAGAGEAPQKAGGAKVLGLAAPAWRKPSRPPPGGQGAAKTKPPPRPRAAAACKTGCCPDAQNRRSAIAWSEGPTSA